MDINCLRFGTTKERLPPEKSDDSRSSAPNRRYETKPC